MIYDVIDDVVSADFNKFMLKELEKCNWLHPGRAEVLDDNELDSGYFLPTFTRDSGPAENDSFILLNKCALEILDLTLDRSNWVFNNVVVDRILWNYYWPNSGVNQHQDAPRAIDNPKQFFISMVYNINDNTGYNIVHNEKVYSAASRCILFQNTDFHSAFNPPESKARYTVNIVFGYDSQSIAQKKAT